MPAEHGSGRLRIRRAEPAELEELCSAFPARPQALHEERLWMQEQGHGTYLIAWLDGRPVGHIEVQFPDERDLDSMLEGRGGAWGEDLWVDPSARGRWIGPALMRSMEREARSAGARRLVFFAGIDTSFAAARAIYRWMGWSERSPEPLIESALRPGLGGDEPYLEIVTLWEKELSPAR
jgi:GNAT superfamily N-acetyltransferase